MASLTLDAVFSATSFKGGGGSYDKFVGGNNQCGVNAGGDIERNPYTWSLATLPTAQIVTSPAFQFVNHQSFGITGVLFEMRIYGVAGTDDPSSDTNQNTWTKCGTGTLIASDNAGFQTGGTIIVPLGQSACDAIAAAAGLTISFAVKFVDESTPASDALANLRGYDNGDPDLHPKLSFTYTPAPVVSTSNPSSDGNRWGWR